MGCRVECRYCPGAASLDLHRVQVSRKPAAGNVRVEWYLVLVYIVWGRVCVERV
jgi:hypothetical protein